MKSSSKASLKLTKRWFLLTHNSLDYYKSSERSAPKLGALVLSSLCSVAAPDERVFKDTGGREREREGGGGRGRGRRGRGGERGGNNVFHGSPANRTLSLVLPLSPPRLLECDCVRP